MFKKLTPDFRFSKFDDVTPDFLISIGIKGILLDIDNTLEPYENAEPGEHVIAWLDSLRERGIKAAFVSNNGRERVELFNKKLGLVAYYKAKKPFKKNLISALSDIGCDPSCAALMGDQVFTDVLAAKNASLTAILLPPIKDKRDLFTRFKRLCEKPILRKYERKKKKEENKK